MNYFKILLKSNKKFLSTGPCAQSFIFGIVYTNISAALVQMLAHIMPTNIHGIGSWLFGMQVKVFSTTTFI
jgi:hypothetical protein